MQTNFSWPHGAALVAALTWVVCAHAAEPVAIANPPPSAEAPNGAWMPNAAAELTRLQEQTVLLKAEIKKLDAQAEVAQRTAALTRLGSAGSVDAGSDAVRVVAIEGLGHRFSATLQSTDGAQFDVSAGDVLPNGLHIVSIASNEVVGRWSSGQTLRLMPVLASRSGAVLNPGVTSGSGSNAALGTAGGAPVANGVPGLPPGYPRSQ
ncbi:type IV pilus biogenesis protein PilP [Paraburkholderia sediminicola]|uniref:Type IV pilus biogenesis protein PilP n=1 Tax=Paraburkholderia metrosideri TaxID=580937 RepID=A0ABW9DP40_9BURK